MSGGFLILLKQSRPVDPPERGHLRRRFDLIVGLELVAGDGRSVLLGVTERLEFVDAPGHADDLKRCRARGYAMTRNRIAITVDWPMRTLTVRWPSLTVRTRTRSRSLP